MAPSAPLPPEEGRVDLASARMRMVGLFLAALVFVGLCVFALVAEPTGRRSAEPGSFAQFALIAGLVLFGVGALAVLRELVRTGPLVSVSPQGIFDRRISNGWIPWSAIASIDEVRVGAQTFLRIEPAPGRDAELPWTRRGRWIARANAGFGGGYWIPGQGVKGGTAAIRDAIAKVRGGR